MKNIGSLRFRLKYRLLMCLLLSMCLVAETTFSMARVERVPFQVTINLQELDANVRVSRGLILSEHPLAQHKIPQGTELAGLPKFGTVTKDEQLRRAVLEFNIALQGRNELNGYTVSQVYAFLGRASRLLGTELQRQAEKSPQNALRHRKEARNAFEESFRQYESAIENDSGSLKYTFAQDYVQAIVFSGNLLSALSVINELEKKQLRPSSLGDYGLLKQKADIYYILGRYEDAGLAYEEWIRKGGTDPYLVEGDALYEKLRNLQRKMGHPNNLPAASSTR
jgi:tetratricopeptide (TPR) repeat protein